MHAQRSFLQPPGWPLWALLSAIPLALALGLVAGMAIATYSGAAGPGASAPPAVDDAAEAPSVSRPSASNAGDHSWQIPRNSASAAPVLPPIVSNGAATAPVTHADVPDGVYFRGIPRDIREARLTLLTDFRTYTGSDPHITWDYQQMRHSGHGVSLVGLLSVAQYPDWVKAMEERPTELTKWLEQSAARVLPAARQDRFRLAWAVVDVLKERPQGFADSEVTLLDNGSYLVIRPLATTADYDKTAVLVRPPANPAAGSPSAPASGQNPWLVYGPVILFNSQDYYRPPETQNARPVEP